MPVLQKRADSWLQPSAPALFRFLAESWPDSVSLVFGTRDEGTGVIVPYEGITPTPATVDGLLLSVDVPVQTVSALTDALYPERVWYHLVTPDGVSLVTGSLGWDLEGSVNAGTTHEVIQGPRGYSVYQIAQQNGYSGSESDFLALTDNGAGNVVVLSNAPRGGAADSFDGTAWKQFNLQASNNTLFVPPFVQWPRDAPSKTLADLIDPATGLLLDNPRLGQYHLWRAQFSYTGKQVNSNLSIDIRFTNPLNTFTVGDQYTAPTARTDGQFTALLHTTSNAQSIGGGGGYRLEVATSAASSIVVTLTAITRVSLATGLSPFVLD